MHDHGVLATVHPGRGVDAVPCVYALAGEVVGVPIDRVKPKASTRLQRERNLEHDPRATLLIDRWHRSDWSRLWWVRAELRWVADPDASLIESLSTKLALKYEQYAERPFAGVLCFDVVGLAGWAASELEE